MDWRRVYPGRCDQIEPARSFAALLFAGTAREDDAALIVSELVSNALLYTQSGEMGGWFGLEISVRPHELAYVAVTDIGGSKGRPVVVEEEDPEEEPREHGRGLLAVSRLAAAVGIHGNPAMGHTVWADLDLRPPGKDASALLVA